MRARFARLKRLLGFTDAPWDGEKIGCEIVLGERVGIAREKIHPRRQTRIIVGDDSMLRGEIVMEKDGATVNIGARVYFGGFISCAEKVAIGNDVLVSGGGGIFDHNSHALAFSLRANDVIGWKTDAKDWTHVPIAPVTIEDKVWIGYSVIILRGVTIGEGAVVGAGAVVTKNVPPWCVFAGNPGRVLRELRADER
jgi:galactoside O-acetyltransferase